ncbi:DUF1992 domain-containing protein [Nocardia terpenica]|nr:DUF1992 domain-containing protein [Nocardia terpenica]
MAMTERKPPGVSYEFWLDKQIREATERGDFDDLPGKGKPLPDAGQPYREDWWLESYLQRQGVGGEGLLPTSLLLRRDLERLPETVRRLGTEYQVRRTVTDLNTRITDWLRMPHGPWVNVAPVDVDEVVEQWRSRRQPVTTTPEAARGHAGSGRGGTDRRTTWWRSLFRRRPEAHP